MKWRPQATRQESGAPSAQFLTFQRLQGTGHACRELCGVLLAAKVEAPDLAGVPPLVEVGGGLVILETPDDGAVDDHLAGGERWVRAGAGAESAALGRGGRGLHLLVRLHFPADHPEGVGGWVVEDLDSAEGLGAGARRQPSLVAVIVEHHSGAAGADDRLAAGKWEGGSEAGSRFWSPSPSGSHSEVEGRCKRKGENAEMQGETPLEEAQMGSDREGKQTGRTEPDRQTRGDKDTNWGCETDGRREGEEVRQTEWKGQTG